MGSSRIYKRSPLAPYTPSLHETTEDRRSVRGHREPLDDAAVEAEVVKLGQPAEVKFDVAIKMATGQVYEAKLEILRSGGGKASLIRDTPELMERVQIFEQSKSNA